MSEPINFSEHHHHHYIPGHPDKFGPGTWWILHLTSYNVDSVDKIDAFIQQLHVIIYNIPCMMCRGHAIEYIKNNDGSKYRDQYYKGRFVGMFMWMSDFHNTVNERKEKDIVYWKDAFREYRDNFNDNHDIPKNGTKKVTEKEKVTEKGKRKNYSKRFYPF